MVEHICIICGNSFFRKRSFRYNASCCSLVCSAIHRSQRRQGRVFKEHIVITCRQCGKSRSTFPCYADRLFCNKRCHMLWQSLIERGDQNYNWRGGYKEYYGPNWRAQRRAARQRDNYQCRACGKQQKGRALDVHHITPFRTFGYIVGENERYKDANHLDNLISLCANCHKRVETGYIIVSPSM
jgi:hypothetical protein